MVVDDVVTSGATLTEAAAALSSGARPGDAPVVAAVVAATPRRLSGGTSRGDLRVVRKRPENVPDHPPGRLSGRGVKD